MNFDRYFSKIKVNSGIQNIMDVSLEHPEFFLI